MVEQINLRTSLCPLRDEGAVPEQINTSMTSIKIKNYRIGAIFRSFFGVLGAKKY